MDTVLTWVQAMLVHWPFLAVLLIFSVVSRVTERIFTLAKATDRRPRWFWYTARATLPLHPIITGAVIGWLWNSPEPNVTSVVESIAYFCMAGAFSTFAGDLALGFAKKRGLDVTLPGEDAADDAVLQAEEAAAEARHKQV